MLELRPYQDAAIERVREAIRAGARRVLLVIATGGGKTVTAGYVIGNTVANGERAIFLAHRKELIDQCSSTLDNLAIDHGVIKSGHTRRDRSKPVQVASIQTLVKREHWEAKLIVIDEAHRATANTYVSLVNRYDDPIVLGLTGSPYRRDGTPLGRKYDKDGNEIGFGFDAIVEVISARELIDQGFLINPTVFGCANPDVSMLKVGAYGDYTPESASKAMQKTIMHGEIITNWVKICGQATGAETIWGEVPIDSDGNEIQGSLFINDASNKTRKKVLHTDCDACTVAFLPTVEDSKKLAEQFNAIGVPAAHIDGNTPDHEREKILRDLHDRKIYVVSNCELLCLDEETEILTNVGWKNIDSLTQFHHVANWWHDGKITFSQPKNIIKRMRKKNENMIYVEGKSVNIRVTEDHRMLSRTSRKHKNYIIKKASNLIGKQFFIPVSGISEPENIILEQENICDLKRYKRRVISNSHHLRKNNGYAYDESITEAKKRLKRSMGLQWKSPNELTLDECWFIGFWIGDGARTPLQSGGVEYVISQSERYVKIIKKLKNVLKSINVDYLVKPYIVPKNADIKSEYIQQRFSMPRGTGFGQQSKNGLYKIEIYLDKDGAEELSGLNGDQLWSLLVGFWHADGSHGSGFPVPNTLIITNTNYKLLSKLQAIATCRNMGTYLSEGRYNGKKSTKLIHTLRITRNKTDHQLVRNRLQIEKKWKKERVWCCSVESTFIITRRKGRVAVVGNCEGWDLPHLECVIGARMTRSKALFKQMGGRLMRPDDEKRFAYILDHAKWTHTHGFLSDPTEHSLRGKEKRSRKGSSECPTKNCPQCGSLHALMVRICEECGYEFPIRETVFTDEDLIELNGKKISSKSEVPLDTRQRAFNLLAKRCVDEKRNPKQAEYLFFKEYGEWPTRETGIVYPRFFWQHKLAFQKRKAQQATAQKAADGA